MATETYTPDDQAVKLTGTAASLARRYSEALYDLAQEQKQMDAVSADINLLHQIAQNSAEFVMIASNPRLTPAQRLSAVQAMAAAARFNAITVNFLGLLARNQRLDLAGAMAAAFIAKLTAARGEFTAEVISAKPLSSQQQERLAGKLGQMAGGEVHLSLKHDAALLGGFVVKMGSKVIDASTRSALERLERQLKSEQAITHKGAA